LRYEDDFICIEFTFSLKQLVFKPYSSIVMTIEASVGRR